MLENLEKKIPLPKKMKGYTPFIIGGAILGLIGLMMDKGSSQNQQESNVDTLGLIDNMNEQLNSKLNQRDHLLGRALEGFTGQQNLYHENTVNELENFRREFETNFQEEIGKVGQLIEGLDKNTDKEKKRLYPDLVSLLNKSQQVSNNSWGGKIPTTVNSTSLVDRKNQMINQINNK